MDNSTVLYDLILTEAKLGGNETGIPWWKSNKNTRDELEMRLTLTNKLLEKVKGITKKNTLRNNGIKRTKNATVDKTDKNL